jgi:hypothetical protein
MLIVIVSTDLKYRLSYHIDKAYDEIKVKFSIL